MSLPWINRRSWYLLISGCALLGGYHQSVIAAGITLPQAINSAVQGNKDLQAVRYTVEQARARLLQAGLP